jgi:hypothetical protein
MGNETVLQKFKELFENIVESNEMKYDGSITNIDYFSLFCKSAASDKLYKFFGVNTCMFNFIYENEDSVLIIFSIPLNSDASAKHIADRVMEITKSMEKCFTTLDFISSNEMKDDKFVYISIIKKVNRGEQNER